MPTPRGFQRRTIDGFHIPGESEYRDEGCSLAPSCLSCPFEVCVMEAWEAKRKRNDDVAVVSYLLTCLGRTPAQVAQVTGAPYQSAWKRIQRGRTILASDSARRYSVLCDMVIGESCIMSRQDAGRSHVSGHVATACHAGHESRDTGPALALVHDIQLQATA